MPALHDIVKKGSTDRSVTLTIIDSTTGAKKTDVVYNSSGIDLFYRREGAAATSITEATLAALTTAHADGGFLHIAAGEYRLDLPDAAFATGANYVDFGGAVTGGIIIGGRVKLVNYDPEDTVRLGLTALPNAAAEASGGLYTRGTGAGQINQDANGRINANAVAQGGTSLTARDIGASVLLSPGTGTGQVNLTSGSVPVTNLTVAASTTLATGTHNPQGGDTYARLGAPAGASTAADIAAVKTQTAAIETDTQDIQSRLPAALTADGNIKADALRVSGSATAADNLENTFDTRYASAWNSTLHVWQSQVKSGITHGGAGTDLTLGDLIVQGGVEVTDIVQLVAGLVGNITGTLSTVTTLTNLPAITANWLTAAGTASDFGTEVATAVWALATRTLTAATNISGPIADQVWEEAIADHSGTAGSTAEALNAAGAAGDPWTTALPGAYGAGSAGYIIGNNINATISSRASQTSVDDIPTNAELATALGTADDAVLAAIAALNNLSSAQVTAAVWHADMNANDNTVGSFGDYFGQMYTETTVSTPTTLGTLATQASVNTIDDFLDTEIAAIKAKTDNLPAAPAAVGDIPTAIQNADALLNRSITNTQDTADVHSLTTVVLAMLESSMSGTTWTIRKTGGTTFTTKTLTVDAGADPITGVT